MALLRSALAGALSGALARVASRTAALPPLFSAPAPLSFAARYMKVRQSIKKRCEHCYIVQRGTLTYMYCKVNPRHKARNGPKVRAGWLKKRNYA